MGSEDVGGAPQRGLLAAAEAEAGDLPPAADEAGAGAAAAAAPLGLGRVAWGAAPP